MDLRVARKINELTTATDDRGVDSRSSRLHINGADFAGLLIEDEMEEGGGVASVAAAGAQDTTGVQKFWSFFVDGILRAPSARQSLNVVMLASTLASHFENELRAEIVAAADDWCI
jgi:hypothetical protein